MASTSLSRTPASSGSRQIATLSAWIKRSNLGSNRIWSDYFNSSNWNDFYFSGGDSLEFVLVEGGSITVQVTSTAKFRDTSGWYHIVLKIDTTQATASDRVIFYVNGEQITDYSTTTYPSLNKNLDLSQNTHTIYIGQNPNASFDGSMAHVHFIDGTAYDADTFGETDTTTGIWKPKTNPSVTYGTNGFFLKFENSGSMGTDSSGNGNNFTVNGTMTQTIDTPSNVFATMNPLADTGMTYAKGNLEIGYSVASANARSTFGVSSGKWYWETKLTTVSADGVLVGICNENVTQETSRGSLTGVYGVQDVTGNSFAFYRDNGSSGVSAGFPVPSQGDIIQCALDLDNSKFYMGINGTFYNLSGSTADPSAQTNPTFSSLISSTWFSFIEYRGGSATSEINFGNGYFGTTAVSSAQNPDDGIGIFEYDVPTGYRALCTKSINAQEYD